MRRILKKITLWIVRIPETFRESDIEEDEFGIRLRKHKRAMYIRTVLLVMLIIGILFLIRYIYTHWLFKSYSVIESEDVYDSVSEYMCTGGKILRYSPDGAVLMEQNMKDEIWNESYNLSKPVVETASDAIAIYDKRGTEIHVYNTEERLGSFVTNSPILFARVSGSGNVAAALQNGEGTEIVYYNSAGEEIAMISPSASKYGYPLSMAVSQDGTMLAVSYIMADGGVIGSRLAFYNFGAAGSDKEDHLMYSEDYPGTVIPDLRYYGKSELMVFLDNGFTFYKGTGKPKRGHTVSFDQEIVSLFCDESRVAFVFRCDEIKHRYTMDVYKHSGKLLNTEYVDIIYDRGHFSDGEIIFCNNNEMAVYTHDGNMRFNGALNEGTLHDVIKTGRNRYFAVTDTQAEMIRLK